MSVATTIEISSAFVDTMDLTVAFSERVTNVLLPQGNVYIPPSDTQTTIQYSSNLKSLSNLSTFGLVSRDEPGTFSTVNLGAGFQPGTGGPNNLLQLDPNIILAAQTVYGEAIPVQYIDGVNDTFPTARPHAIGSIRLYYNGLLVSSDNYTSDGEYVTLTTFVPYRGEGITVDYTWMA